MKHVYLCGIAGTGMSSLAGLFKAAGFGVSGSDSAFYPPVDGILRKMEVTLHSPYAAANIPADTDFCVIGNIISRGNPEAEHILNHRIRYYSMADALYRYFIRGQQSVVAAGTHGKTTISSFITHMLRVAGRDPGCFIGGKPVDLPANYAIGGGEFFVSEGDEYETSFFDRSSKFLKYYPDYLVLSALEYDHADFFPDEHQYLRAFRNLVNQVPSKGLIILHNDGPMNAAAVQNAFTPVKTYGTTNNPDYAIKDLEYRAGTQPGQNGRLTFRLVRAAGNPTGPPPSITLNSPLAGRFNAWNLAAGIILGLHLDIPENTLREAVESFNGVERRLRTINRIDNTLFLEDFAHHPTSLSQVLQSLRGAYPDKKIIALFEPRSWSLRRNLFQQRLAEAFDGADTVFIKNVYQEEKIPPHQRLDVEKLKTDLEHREKTVTVFDNPGEIKNYLLNLDYHQDQLVIILSNGGFDGIPAFAAQLDGNKPGKT